MNQYGTPGLTSDWKLVEDMKRSLFAWGHVSKVANKSTEQTKVFGGKLVQCVISHGAPNSRQDGDHMQTGFLP